MERTKYALNGAGLFARTGRLRSQSKVRRLRSDHHDIGGSACMSIALTIVVDGSVRVLWIERIWKDRTAVVGTAEIGTAEIGTAEIGIAEIGIAEIGSG